MIKKAETEGTLVRMTTRDPSFKASEMKAKLLDCNRLPTGTTKRFQHCQNTKAYHLHPK